jgi:hypothetical protein
MKIREIWFLLRYEVMRGAWLIPLAYGLFTLEIYDRVREQSKVMFSMNAGGQEQGYLMILWFAFSAVFLNTRALNQTTQGSGWWGAMSFDFFFSRALDRRAWFMVKAGLFTLLVLTPEILVCWTSRQAAPVKIELPYNPMSHRPQMVSFYRSEFSGAYLEQADTGRNEDYVVVPHIRQRQALCSLAMNLLLLSCFQVAAFLFWPRGWGVAIPFFMILPAYFWYSLPSMHTPSRYEAGLALVGNYPVTVFTILLLIFGAAQSYCCWKFVRTECV